MNGSMSDIGSPFHHGESLVQRRLGVQDMIEPWARRVVQPALPAQHRDFYAQRPFLVVAARDAHDRPWATLVAGEPGFTTSPQPGVLDVAAVPIPGDALGDALHAGADVGVLGIELHTRRRNRVNGRVDTRHPDGFQLRVDQAFGNCPQYIHERNWRSAPGDAPAATRTQHQSFTPELRRFIEAADTFFIATGHRDEGESTTVGMDASHRGGEPGFVNVTGPDRLVFPDYAGNNHFNTLGNLELDPRTGLLFVDFEQGNLLQLTGRATVDWREPDQSKFPGARRLVEFELETAVELRSALPLRFASPAGGGAIRELRLIDKVAESDDVTSFYFETRDGGPAPSFSAGQYLPLALDIEGVDTAVERTYSISGPPGEGFYRISVKRHDQGLVSRLLHDRVQVGHILSASTPRGDFVLDHESSRPVVLLSSGVGLTPLVSMLHDLAANPARLVWFVHGARDRHHHPLADEVRRVGSAHAHIETHFAYSRPRPDDAGHYDSEGRIDAGLLETLLPDLDADYYVCGPLGFMADVQNQLVERGVSSHQIHAETFGPAS